MAAVAALVVALTGGASPPVPPPRAVPNAAFRSADPPRAPAVVWAVGDGADGSRAARAVARRIAADAPDRLLYLGDVYEHGSPEDFRRNYHAVYGELAPITAPTPGNHEWPAHRRGYDRYWRERTGAPTPPWYSFRIGGWRIASLNSEAPHGRGSPQLRWLQRRLRRWRGTCTLAFWHRPRYSAGSHGDQPDVDPLWDAVSGRVRLVLNGHDHDLQRLHPRDDVTALVVGAGGRGHHPVEETDPRLAFADDQRDGALRMALRPGGARLEIVAASGAVLDRSAVSCRSGGAPRR